MLSWLALIAAIPSDRELLDKLRDCARIEQLAPRAACYDRYLRPAPVAAPPTLPPPSQPPKASFGSETLRTAPRPAPDQSFTARVTAAVERQPGIWLITLEDGAQWQFANSAAFTYQPPVRGAAVEIRRAALGSFLLRYNDQPSVRVLRVR